MKGRCRTAVFFTALALLFVSLSGFSQAETTRPESTPKHRKTKRSTQPVSQLNSDNTYVVLRGDSLIKIAREHQTTAQALKAANGLANSRIKAGQKLVIPVLQTAESKKEKPQNTDLKTWQNAELSASHISQLKEQSLDSEDETSSMRLRLVEAGFKMIGVRYRRSGGSEKTGFDCSGLVKNLFSKFNIELPRSSREQFNQGEKVDRDKLEIGDLVFFSSGGARPTHVGIYVGNDKFLHAARKARQVMVSDLNKIWYTMRYLGARRIADLWGDDPEPQPAKQ